MLRITQSFICLPAHSIVLGLFRNIVPPIQHGCHDQPVLRDSRPLSPRKVAAQFYPDSLQEVWENHLNIALSTIQIAVHGSADRANAPNMF